MAHKCSNREIFKCKTCATSEYLLFYRASNIRFLKVKVFFKFGITFSCILWQTEFQK